jgi:arylsulfatase A-like enzyme
LLVSALYAGGVTHFAIAAPTEIARPNIVIFFVDDLGQRDLGCYGSAFYETPRIDALAKQSVRFTHFYSANPVCSPTRAALMTGKAPQRLGITQWIPQPNPVHLALEETTLGEAFSGAGYRTGYIGKWHLGDEDAHQPIHQGFEWVRCVNRGGQPASYFHPYAGRKRDGIAYWDVPDLEDARPDDYLTDLLTDKAIEFISGQEQDARPFLLVFAHYAVHTPIQSPSDLVEKYQAKRKTVYGEGIAEPASERNQSQSRTRQDDAAYAAMVENLDTNVGRVLDKLKESNLEKNTIVLFTSDNGGLSTLKKVGPTSCKPFRAGKGWTYEGGIRIPTLVRWPEKIAPADCTTPAITTDLYPTLLELAGLKAMPAQNLDGRSLVSAIQQNPSEALTNRFLAWYYPHDHGSGHTPSSALRQGDLKLIHLIDQDRYELYDLSHDVGEQHDLAADRPDDVRRLAQVLTTWLDETIPEASSK